MGDDFYRSKDPTNSIKVLKEQIVHRQIKHTISKHEHKTQQVPLIYTNMVQPEWRRTVQPIPPVTSSIDQRPAARH